MVDELPSPKLQLYDVAPEVVFVKLVTAPIQTGEAVNVGVIPGVTVTELV
jgi:hypothetical protein